MLSIIHDQMVLCHARILLEVEIALRLITLVGEGSILGDESLSRRS